MIERVQPCDREVDRRLFLSDVKHTVDPVQSALADVRDPGVIEISAVRTASGRAGRTFPRITVFLLHPVEIGLAAVNLCNTAEDLIIRPEDHRSGRILHIVKHLTLRAVDSRPVDQKLQMAVADGGDHGDIGPRDLREHCHLPKVADSHLQDRSFVFRPDLEDRQGKTDAVVEIARCLQNAELLA